ncbi:Uncharacterised protein [Vibrio cholerae]|nr:Uncharacterised protein [Vibrio cholerae]
MRIQSANFTVTIGEMLCTTITQVIAVHRSNYHVLELHIMNGLCELFRLFRFWCIGAAMGNVTEWAATGTDST